MATPAGFEPATYGLEAKIKLVIEAEEKLSQTPSPSKIEQDARLLHTVLDNTRREISRNDLYSLSEAVTRQIMPNLFANAIAAVQGAVSENATTHTLRVKYDGVPNTVSDVASAYTGVLEGLPGNRISIQIEKVPVNIKEKEYLHRWNIPEIPSFDFGTELVKDAVCELDSDLLALIRETAGSPSPSSTFSMDKVTGTPSFVGDVHAALAILINRQANLIAARTRRGAGNKVVVSPTALTILQSATTSAFARTTNIEHADSSRFSLSRCKYVGMLNNSMEVYCDPYAVDNEPVIVAYKGNDTDAGVFFNVYAPFIIHTPEIAEDGTKKAKLTHKTNLWALKNHPNALGNGADYFGCVGIDISTLTFV